MRLSAPPLPFLLAKQYSQIQSVQVYGTSNNERKKLGIVNISKFTVASTLSLNIRTSLRNSLPLARDSIRAYSADFKQRIADAPASAKLVIAVYEGGNDDRDCNTEHCHLSHLKTCRRYARGKHLNYRQAIVVILLFLCINLRTFELVIDLEYLENFIFVWDNF